jgi:hypothetical protein
LTHLFIGPMSCDVRVKMVYSDGRIRSCSLELSHDPMNIGVEILQHVFDQARKEGCRWTRS